MQNKLSVQKAFAMGLLLAMSLQTSGAAQAAQVSRGGRAKALAQAAAAMLLFSASVPDAHARGFSLKRVAKALATGGASEVIPQVAPVAPPPVKAAVAAVEKIEAKVEDKVEADAKAAKAIADQVAANAKKTADKALEDFKREAPRVAEQIKNEHIRVIENVGNTLVKTIEDTPRTIGDLGEALYKFSVAQLEYEPKQFQNFSQRAFEGKWADAVAHLGIDRFHNDEVNFFVASQKSLIIHVVGEAVVSYYAGPYGAAAYASWYTYNATKDPALALKAGLIAGATSAASSAASGIGTSTATAVAAQTIAQGAIAGVAAAASGGGKEDVLRAMLMAGTSVVIKTGYEKITEHPLNPGPSEGDPYTKNTPPYGEPGSGPDSPPRSAYKLNPDGTLYKDAKGNYHVDVRLLDPNRPHTGLGSGLNEHGLSNETGPLMPKLSRIPFVNAGSVLHDVLGEDFHWEGLVLRGTIPPLFVITYYGTESPTMALLLKDVQKKRDADVAAQLRP